MPSIGRRLHSDTVADFVGLSARLPWTALLLAICVLSLAGSPPLGAFVGKTMLFGAALAAGWTWLAVVMAAYVALARAHAPALNLAAVAGRG